MEKGFFVFRGEDYFNSIKSVSHPKLLPLSFQNPNINSLKDRETAKGFPLVWGGGKEKRSSYQVGCCL